MEKVVVITGVEFKTGANDNGGWKLAIYKDAGGNKFQTFDEGLQQVIQTLMGQPIRVTWVDEPRQYTTPQGQTKTTTNHVLQTAELAVGEQPDNTRIPNTAAGGGGSSSGGGGRQADPRRDARIASQWALGLAKDAIVLQVQIGNIPAEALKEPDTFVAVTELLAAKFLEASGRLVEKISGVPPSSSGEQSSGAWTGQTY